MNELDAPMVYLAPEQHAFLVIGDGKEPLITWSKSYRLACEQADIHDATVVAVPILQDMSWRAGPHPDDPQVRVPVSRLPRAEVIDPVVPPGLGTVPDVARDAGYPVGRAARKGQGGSDHWSSTRDGVVGQDTVPVGPASGAVLGHRVVGTASVPPSPELAKRWRGPRTPEEYEASLLAAFGGDERAVDAFHQASADGIAVCAGVLAGLAHLPVEPTRRVIEGPGHKIPTGL